MQKFKCFSRDEIDMKMTNLHKTNTFEKWHNITKNNYERPSTLAFNISMKIQKHAVPHRQPLLSENYGRNDIILPIQINE